VRVIYPKALPLGWVMPGFQPSGSAGTAVLFRDAMHRVSTAAAVTAVFSETLYGSTARAVIKPSTFLLLIRMNPLTINH
jgi:hypothetical protein